VNYGDRRECVVQKLDEGMPVSQPAHRWWCRWG